MSLGMKRLRGRPATYFPDVKSVILVLSSLALTFIDAGKVIVLNNRADRFALVVKQRKTLKCFECTSTRCIDIAHVAMWRRQLADFQGAP